MTLLRNAYGLAISALLGVIPALAPAFRNDYVTINASDGANTGTLDVKATAIDQDETQTPLGGL